VSNEPGLSLRYAQGQVFNNRTRFRVLVAGRRFGKSYLACIELLRGAIERPGETFFYAAPTYRMAKDIAWKVLKKLVPRAWIKAKNETDLKLELVNGSTIELKGTENAMALRGRSLAGVVLDEAAFMDAEVWFEVIRPALADKQGWALFISTPDGTASWFYDLWCYAVEADKDWKRWQFTTIDGDNVPPEEIEAARGQLDSRTFRQEFEASFENLSGLVAISFSDANIAPEIKDIPVLPLLVGLDFNVSPMSAVCAVKYQSELWVFDEIVLTGGATTWDFCETLIDKYGMERRIITCPDPTGAARKTSGVGATDHAILRKAGLTVSTPKAPWKIRDKITCVNMGLLDATGTRRIKIHPRCVELIKSLRTLTYTANTNLPNKNLGVDHSYDALAYMCLQVFNLAKPETIGSTDFRVW
jgi:Terminase large subunit, T4likevirus-type, N-terminal